MLKAFIQSSSRNFFSLFLDLVSLVLSLFMMISIVCIGSLTTSEAEQTSVILTKVSNEFLLDDSQKIDFVYFLAKAKTRNLNLSNSLFDINWNIFVSVSKGKKVKKFQNNELFVIIHSSISFQYRPCQLQSLIYSSLGNLINKVVNAFKLKPNYFTQTTKNYFIDVHLKLQKM